MFFIFDLFKMIDEKNIGIYSILKISLIFIGFGIIFFIIFFVLLGNIINSKMMAVCCFIISILWLLVVYILCIRVQFSKPKYKDGKYVWKDGRVYEGDWQNGNANGKGKLIYSDGSYYEGEFKDGKFSGKGKIMFSDGGFYEGDFKNGKPHGMGIMNMKNGYYYEGEFSDGEIKGRFMKKVLTSGVVIEGEFKGDNNNIFEGVGKVSYPDGKIFEGSFVNGNLHGEGKVITSEGRTYRGIFDEGELKKGRLFLKNGECFEGDFVDGELKGLVRCYFLDGSYYEGEYDGWWQGTGTYLTKKGDEYQTEFPYEIINVFENEWIFKKEKIDGDLKYIPKTEKENLEEKNKYLEITERGTLIQQEIAKLSLSAEEEAEKCLNSLKTDRSIGNYLEFHMNIIKLHQKYRGENKKIADKNHIKYSKNDSYYSYGRYFYELDCCYDKAIEVSKTYVKIYNFLDTKNVSDFVIRKDKKDKERVILIDEFSDKYEKYVQSCLDWREYEKRFWEHNFKPDKNDN